MTTVAQSFCQATSAVTSYHAFSRLRMRNKLVLLCAVLTVLLCGASKFAFAQTNEWVWMGGSSAANQHGVYGTPGVAGSSNIPGARFYSASWTDASGNLWVFGGAGYGIAGAPGYLNDLWELNASTGEWAWMSGSPFPGEPGVYGTQRIPSAENFPGGRGAASTWTDSSGNFWLFGGEGIYADGTQDYLNDLWEFNPSTLEWTWMGGGITPVSTGTLGVPAASNIPNGRDMAVSWTDASGNFWLFGGENVVETALGGGGESNGFTNDLWEFNPATSEWTWMNGNADAQALPGVYGILGVPSTSNFPGSRAGASLLTDGSGNHWLFGGQGFDGNYDQAFMNDLWELNPSYQEWAWMGGSSAATTYFINLSNQGTFLGPASVYGTLGQPAPGNVPSGRATAANWVNSNGNLWIFGGEGFDSIGNYGYLNDLWQFNPVTQEWAWMSGSKVLGSNGGQPGVYGTLDTPAPENTPSSRYGAASWTDSHGNLWLFGGFESSSTGAISLANDLWEYQTSAPSLPTAATPTFGVTPGTYTAAQTVAITDTTSGAIIHFTTDGTTPTASSTVYNGPISVTSTETVEALAIANGYSNSAVASAAYTIMQTPTITWATPAAVTYGTALSATQLDATSSVPGTFVYSPAAGTILTAGSQPLTVAFTPTDTTDYTTATSSVTLTVNQAAPVIAWPTPAALTYGTALSAPQLDASSTVAGSFTYSPAAGTILTAGSHVLTATFTPTDTTDYTTATSSVTLTVNQATPAVTWATPAAITYGTALSATQLGASSQVAGSFTYSPAAGTVLAVGSHTLSATFTPTDTTDYTTATATVILVINPAPGFTLGSSPASLSVGQGATITSTLTVTPISGFSGNVTLAASGLPSGVTAAFSKNPTTATSVLTLTANKSATVGTYSVTIKGTSGTLTATTTIALTIKSSFACHVGYSITSQWSGGFGATLAIDNTGTVAISNWTLTWTFANGQTVTQFWNGNENQAGSNVNVTNMSYNGAISAGGSYTAAGFNATWNNKTNAVPASFAINGQTCN